MYRGRVRKKIADGLVFESAEVAWIFGRVEYRARGARNYWEAKVEYEFRGVYIASPSLFCSAKRDIGNEAAAEFPQSFGEYFYGIHKVGRVLTKFRRGSAPGRFALNYSMYMYTLTDFV